MDMILAAIAATVLILVLCARAHYSGFRAGFDAGVDDGVTVVMEDLRDGNITVADGRVSIGKRSRIALVDGDDAEIPEMDLADTEIEDM